MIVTATTPTWIIADYAYVNIVSFVIGSNQMKNVRISNIFFMWQNCVT